MLIDSGGGLGTAIAGGVGEVESGDAMFAEGAGECGTAVHLFGCVISHIFIVVLIGGGGLGQ